MITPPNLNLSILDPDPPERRGLIQMPPTGGLLTFAKGDLAGQTFRVDLTPCAHPECDCYSVRVICWPMGSLDGSSLPAFWIDVELGRSLGLGGLKKHPQALLVAKAMQSELTPADWRTLFFWFRINKQKMIAQTKVEEFETDTLPEAGNGVLAHLSEVFPRGRFLDFQMGDGFWTAEEFYCVNAGCECEESILSFFQYRDGRAREIVPQGDPPTLSYDYQAGKIKREMIWHGSAPPAIAFMEALESAEPALKTWLKSRHTLLKALYLRRDFERRKAASTDFRGILRNNPRPSPAPAPAPKTGRNDPCPCGSGKKFKHCCLGKGQEPR